MSTKAGTLRALVVVHRWLGVAGGVLFLLWFASGIVMMYARMPVLQPAERLARLPPLDLETARIEPLRAANEIGGRVQRLRIAMLGERPVYRLAVAGQWHTVFADTGQFLQAMSTEDAMRIARDFWPEAGATIRHDRRLDDPDQWTLQSRSFLPLHRVDCGDAAGTQLYVSERTGEVVMRTTRKSRRWGTLGAVVHWFYVTPLRRHSQLWRQTMIWASIAGCVLCLSGLVIGLWRYSPGKHHAPSGRRSSSPYVGAMRWHHYAGLLFGLATFAWIASGCLSLDPWQWHSETTPTEAQRLAVAGGPLRLGVLEPTLLREATSEIASSFPPRELHLLQFLGEPFLIAYRPPTTASSRAGRTREIAAFLSPVLPLEHRLVSALAPERPIGPHFEEAKLMAAARDAMPGFDIVDSTWLDDYDSYYYGRPGSLPLPVLRLRYDDDARTWLYLDPQRGLPLHREQRSSRLNRWLYRGLHRLDLPWLYHRRPLWDAVVLLLLGGGLLQSTTSMLPALRRLRRLLRRGGYGSAGP